MGRDLQKKKRRSSRSVVKQPHRPKLRNPLGNSIIAKAWNKDETMTQNYRRLGLTARLKAPTGGTEKFTAAAAAAALVRDGQAAAAGRRSKNKDPFHIASVEKSVITEAFVERDEAGNIVAVRHAGAGNKKRASKRDNPLNDPLLDLETDSEADEMETGYEEWGGIEEEEDDEDDSTAIVKQLEAEAAQVRPTKPRTQSAREHEWIQELFEKHGDDTRAMAWDKRLNPMQQTESDIAKRLKKWKIANRMIRPGVTE